MSKAVPENEPEGSFRSGASVVVREWHARATRGGAVAYRAHYHRAIEPRYRAAAGFRGAALMRRPVDDDLVEIVLLSHWESMESIQAFSGPDVTAAVAEPLAEVLIAYDERVVLWKAFV